LEIGLTNAKLSVGKTHELNTQKVTPARTSIAEDAIFIPKPHKRVEFKAVSSQEASVQDLKLPGSGGSTDVNGEHIKLGSLGKHGLTAEMDASSYRGNGTSPRMEMVINNVPEKDFGVIAGQEEGRQTNHAETTHYSQQYDAYGRPRIGFSREPYDFAATKYIVKSSEIKMKSNVAQSQEAFAYADKRYNKLDPALQDDRNMFLGAPDEAAKKLEEVKKPSIPGNEGKDPVSLPGQNAAEERKANEVITNLPGQNIEKLEPNEASSKKEYQEKIGIDFTRLITPSAKDTGNNNPPDHTRDKQHPSISLKI